MKMRVKRREEDKIRGRRRQTYQAESDNHTYIHSRSIGERLRRKNVSDNEDPFTCTICGRTLSAEMYAKDTMSGKMCIDCYADEDIY